MSTTMRHETTIEADPNLPTITIVREFEAPAERVFRAWTEPELVARWLGPRSTTMRIDRWDAKTGGGYRYAAQRDGEVLASFYGSFHEVRPSERLVQTFTFDGYPDGVSLETMTFEELAGGRCRLTSLSVVNTMEVRDLIMSSGMEVGVHEGYARLEELLAYGAV
jgi:uncharacterized protein YndB with AHSA1/START domain